MLCRNPVLSYKQRYCDRMSGREDLCSRQSLKKLRKLFLFKILEAAVKGAWDIAWLHVSNIQIDNNMREIMVLIKSDIWAIFSLV